jgi:hypothetical protein
MEGETKCSAAELSEKDHVLLQSPVVTDKLLRKLRKKGDLQATLDRTLEPLVPPGKPGRRKGCGNCQWTQKMDESLKDLCTRLGPSTAKRMMQKRLIEKRTSKPGEYRPRPDSVRNAVERRMAFLGLQTGRERKRVPSRTAKPWTQKQIEGLLGSVGGDLIDKSVEDRTKHTIKAARAKLRRLGYAAEELRSVAFTTEELAIMLQVTARQVERWKEKGWLKTTRRRVTDKDLAAFIKEHPERIPYDLLSREVQVFLLGLGYPAPEAPKFQATVKSILDDVAGRKKRKDAHGDDWEPKLSRGRPMSLHWIPVPVNPVLPSRKAAETARAD